MPRAHSLLWQGAVQVRSLYLMHSLLNPGNTLLVSPSPNPHVPCVSKEQLVTVQLAQSKAEMEKDLCASVP